MLRSHGETLSDEVVYPDFEVLAFNYRMTDIQAAIRVQQMKKHPLTCSQLVRHAGHIPLAN
jgi:dTDP-4-amino-4,6-dideoxygalactose transaminase